MSQSSTTQEVLATISEILAPSAGELETGFAPDPSSQLAGQVAPIAIDSAGNVRVRATVLTDERSFRDDFPGSSLYTAVGGTVSMVNGSDLVTGVGTDFTTLRIGQLIKRTVDGSAAWAEIESVVTATELTLVSAYTGTTGGGVHSSNWADVTATGGTVTVGSGLVNLNVTGTSGSEATIEHAGDYGPVYIRVGMSISARNANQSSAFGLADNWVTPACLAMIIFDGTNNRELKFRTAGGLGATEAQETRVTLQVGQNTSQQLQYQIDVEPDACTLSIAGRVVAQHTIHIPGPYDNMRQGAKIINTGASTAATLAIDFVYFQNVNKIEIDDSFTGTPQVVSTVPGNVNSSSAFGYVSTAAVTRVVCQSSAYAEQAANAQRQLISSSASDTAAGVGARTIRLTYLDQAGAGPFVEIITLNGTTAVNTVNTNICFIERIEVETVGSSGGNVGTITLRTLAAVSIWTIPATDIQTYGARHYVPAGKTCFVTSLIAGNNQTNVANGLQPQLFAMSIGSGLAERPVTNRYDLVGTLGNQAIPYKTPIPVVGPARIQCWITPRNAAATVQRAEFTYYEV